MSDMRVVRGPRTITPHAFPPGRMPERWVPGDVLLTHNSSGVFPRLLGLEEKLRYRSAADEPFGWFNHAAVVVDPDPLTGEPRLAEAIGSGMTIGPAAKYADQWFAYVDIGADAKERREIVEFAEEEAHNHGRYGTLRIISLAGALLTGGRVTVGLDGSEISSGLVAKALRGGGYWWERERGEREVVVDEQYLTPADLAAAFHTETIRTGPGPAPEPR